MTATTDVRELPILFKGPMVRAILDGTKTQTRRVVKPQPPSIHVVAKRAGTGFGMWPPQAGWTGSGPGVWSVTGPVWAVREIMGAEPRWRCPHGQPGDLLYVRETWGPVTDYFGMSDDPEQVAVLYHADGSEEWREIPAGERAKANGQIARYVDLHPVPRRPSIFMPKWAARIWLRVTDVRVERVQEISEEDAEAEGVEPVLRHRGWAADGASAGGDLSHADAFAELWDSINADRGHPWESNPWVWVVAFERTEAP